MANNTTTDGLTLRQVFNDPILARGFDEFCKVQHADENILFYKSVETFRELAVNEERMQSSGGGTSSVNGTDSSSNEKKSRIPLLSRMFGGATGSTRNVNTTTTTTSTITEITPPDGGNTTTNSTIPPNIASATAAMSPKGSSRKGLIAHVPIDIRDRAQVVFEDFLTPASKKWVCIDLGLSEKMEEHLKTRAPLDSTFFDAAQKQVFDNMEKDLLPRFLKAFEDARIRELQGGPISISSPRGSVRYIPSADLRAALSGVNSLNGE
jgi:hypothetical protein